MTIVFSGTTIGSGLPGLVAPVLLVHHAWPSLFLLGGFVPIVIETAEPKLTAVPACGFWSITVPMWLQ